jgi:redox-sensitive bicupin YhaK (pirin superfamily)
MLQVLRAAAGQTHNRGSFHIRRMRPGVVLGDGADPAFGPLSAIDHANLDVGTVVRMHEHRNDEILSYLWRGTMFHEDTAGHRIPISANKLMMMNAGKSFWHEERTPDEPVEMLQIFVRPNEADLPALVNFYDRPDGAPMGEWGLVAGPKGTNAPLTVRNAVRVYDVHLHERQEIAAVVVEGLSPWLYVMDGVVEVGTERLGKGDAVSDLDQPLPIVRALGDATLVLFLVDRAAPASLAGTISGH